MNITVTGGLTVGAEVKNMPIILEGRTSIYEEAVKNGVFAGTFAEFIASLASGGVDDALLVEKIKRVLKDEVNALNLNSQIDEETLVRNISEVLEAGNFNLGDLSSETLTKVLEILGIEE